VAAQADTLKRFLRVPDEQRQFKFVIQDRRDVEDAVGVLDAVGYDGAVVLQPEHKAGRGRELFDWWPWDRYPKARLIPQTHKIVGLH
jgi:hypothetical protein